MKKLLIALLFTICYLLFTAAPAFSACYMDYLRPDKLGCGSGFTCRWDVFYPDPQKAGEVCGNPAEPNCFCYPDEPLPEVEPAPAPPPDLPPSETYSDVPAQSCSSDASYEVVPSCVACPEERSGNTVLFCWGNQFRLCETDPAITGSCQQTDRDQWWCSPGVFPTRTVKYNSITFPVPEGGVHICDSNMFGCDNPGCRGLIVLPRLAHPAPPFHYQPEPSWIQGLTSLIGKSFSAILRHSDDKTRVMDVSPAITTIDQAFPKLMPSQAKPILNSPSDTEQVKLKYTTCEDGQGKPIEMSGSLAFQTQPFFLRHLSQTLALTQLLTGKKPTNLNPHPESGKNNFTVVGSTGEPVGHPRCEPFSGLDAKAYEENSQGESRISGEASIFAQILETSWRLLETGLQALFGKTTFVVRGQSMLISSYHQPQAESYSHTLKSFIPKGVEVPKECGISKNNVAVNVDLFSHEGGLQADACSPKGEEEVFSHNTTMKFLLPKALSEQYQSPWEEPEDN